ncbi:hypothetical protein D7I46_04490 [Lactococcus allomyrinae]|uniref:Uncharacterized protein n=1 Tax=Lactococcus allomyrinae TaxID=2419773 RepID=A0A387BEB9_9LACT|nr:hypothetical protein D7I46_04490 [Lactococcus allomyrinae]
MSMSSISVVFATAILGIVLDVFRKALNKEERSKNFSVLLKKHYSFFGFFVRYTFKVCKY